MSNVTSRNNILHVYKPWHASINDNKEDPAGDYDYDMYNGRIDAAPGAEPHGIKGTPIYAVKNGTNEFCLSPGSPGHGQGQMLPGFNDDYSGNGPDVGAHETGTPPFQFGVDAYRSKVAESTGPRTAGPTSGRKPTVDPGSPPTPPNDKQATRKSRRTWTDATGKYAVEAEFGGFANGVLRLRKLDGTEIRIPVGRLSETDKEWLRNRRR